jgi:hypothetical protein
MRADLKVRKKKRIFCKESTLFNPIVDDVSSDYNICCKQDFKNSQLWISLYPRKEIKLFNGDA